MTMAIMYVLVGEDGDAAACCGVDDGIVHAGDEGDSHSHDGDMDDIIDDYDDDDDEDE